MADDAEEFRIELTRVVDRLDSIPLERAARCAVDVHTVARSMLDRLRAIDPDIPPDAELPVLGPQGLGSMLRVLGRDLDRAHGRFDLAAVTAELADLRRRLP